MLRVALTLLDHVAHFESRRTTSNWAHKRDVRWRNSSTSHGITGGTRLPRQLSDQRRCQRLVTRTIRAGGGEVAGHSPLRAARRADFCGTREHAGPEKGELTGPNPVDRGKYGSKIHLITERTGLPLSIGVSGANTHDSQALIPLVKGIPPIRSRRGRRRRRPHKLHADKGYDYNHLRRWLSSRGIRHRIARKGIETSQRLGRHRWTIERTMAWLAGCRRLHRRYERKADHFLAFTSIACTLICYRRLAK